MVFGLNNLNSISFKANYQVNANDCQKKIISDAIKPYKETISSDLSNKLNINFTKDGAFVKVEGCPAYTYALKEKSLFKKPVNFVANVVNVLQEKQNTIIERARLLQNKVDIIKKK